MQPETLICYFKSGGDSRIHSSCCSIVERALIFFVEGALNTLLQVLSTTCSGSTQLCDSGRRLLAWVPLPQLAWQRALQLPAANSMCLGEPSLLLNRGLAALAHQDSPANSEYLTTHVSQTKWSPPCMESC